MTIKRLEKQTDGLIGTKKKATGRPVAKSQSSELKKVLPENI